MEKVIQIVKSTPIGRLIVKNGVVREISRTIFITRATKRPPKQVRQVNNSSVENSSPEQVREKPVANDKAKAKVNICDDDIIEVLPYNPSPTRSQISTDPFSPPSLTESEKEQLYRLQEESCRGRGLRYEPAADIVDMTGDKEYPQFDLPCMQIRGQPLPRKSFRIKMRQLLSCVTCESYEDALPASASMMIDDVTTLHRLQGDHVPDLSPDPAMRALRRRHGHY